MKTPTPQEFINYRNARHLTQSAVAVLVHRKLRTIQDWEAGKSPVDLACWELLHFKVGK